MKRAIAVAVACLGAAAALLAAADFQPLKVKTGLWQMTQTSTWTGLPQQWAAVIKNGKTINYKSCVKAKDLTTNPWTDGDDSKCVWKVLKSDGTDMEITGTSCELGKEWGMTTEGTGKIHVVDSENGTGTMNMTISGNGQTIKGRFAYTGKWIDASCPTH
ncbi:MAG TPA: DUF3617 family protein [Candidatus Sulfotelmatobacter sp.]|nr:DUF3617 family protein [Candidatus Sulfotelmatobacter sp.]